MAYFGKDIQNVSASSTIRIVSAVSIETYTVITCSLLVISLGDKRRLCLLPYAKEYDISGRHHDHASPLPHFPSLIYSHSPGLLELIL